MSSATTASASATHVWAEANPLLIPEVVDLAHATRSSAVFFHSFFTAKSRHDVDATMKHFSESTLTYIEATLGWAFYTHGALKDVWVRYMPTWPTAGTA